MDRIVLASVPFSTSLPDALSKIRRGTRAIVVTGPDGARLVTAGDILEARNTALDAGQDPEGVNIGQTVLGQVPVDALPLPGNSQILESIDLNLQLPGLTLQERQHFEVAFHEHDSRYAIQHLGSDAAIVVTASERFASELGSSFTICTCVGDPKHTFEPRQLRLLGRCNKPHGVQVHCEQVDATA